MESFYSAIGAFSFTAASLVVAAASAVQFARSFRGDADPPSAALKAPFIPEWLTAVWSISAALMVIAYAVFHEIYGVRHLVDQDQLVWKLGPFGMLLFLLLGLLKGTEWAYRLSGKATLKVVSWSLASALMIAGGFFTYLGC